MTVKVDFKVHGLKELQKALTQLPKELVSKNGGPVRTAAMAATLIILREAQETIPDRDDVQNTERLAGAIKRRRMNKVRKGSEGDQVYIKGGKNRADESGAYYAPWVEFGALGKPPTRWFSNAIKNKRKEATDIFRTRLAGSIARIAKKIGNENIRAVAAQVKKL